jgi:hypothetical protein
MALVDTRPRPNSGCAFAVLVHAHACTSVLVCVRTQAGMRVYFRADIRVHCRAVACACVCMHVVRARSRISMVVMRVACVVRIGDGRSKHCHRVLHRTRPSHIPAFRKRLCGHLCEQESGMGHADPSEELATVLTFTRELLRI